MKQQFILLSLVAFLLPLQGCQNCAPTQVYGITENVIDTREYSHLAQVNWRIEFEGENTDDVSVLTLEGLREPPNLPLPNQYNESIEVESLPNDGESKVLKWTGSITLTGIMPTFETQDIKSYVYTMSLVSGARTYKQTGKLTFLSVLAAPSSDRCED